MCAHCVCIDCERVFVRSRIVQSLVEWPIAVCACLLCALLSLVCLYVYSVHRPVSPIRMLCCCMFLPFLFNSRFVLPFPSIRFVRTLQLDRLNPNSCHTLYKWLYCLLYAHKQTSEQFVRLFLERRSQHNVVASCATSIG